MTRTYRHDDQTAALIFYVVVGAAGLLATLATRFPFGIRVARPVVAPQGG